MADSVLVRRIKVFGGSILIGLLVGFGARLAIFGTRPVTEIVHSILGVAIIFATLGGGSTLVYEAWHKASRHRGIKFGGGLILMSAPFMWVVPLPF